MDIKYSEMIENVSTNISNYMSLNIEELLENSIKLDEIVQEKLRDIGKKTLEKLYSDLLFVFDLKVRERGMAINETTEISYKTILGEIRVRSPYYRDKETKESYRPMREELGIEGGGVSAKVERALSDFGIEKSFSRACQQFKEHYGFEVSKSCLRLKTLEVSNDAEEYIEKRLEKSVKMYDNIAEQKVNKEAMLAELDGCEIRTGVFKKIEYVGEDGKPCEKKKKVENWRDVRTGLIRPLDEVDASYISGLESHSDICEQLFALACERGLSSKTKVVAPGDGGHGIREELESHFPNVQFILDVFHLKQHLFETAEDMGIEDAIRNVWVKRYFDQIYEGEVCKVIKEFEELYEKSKNDRLRRLIGYISRFKDAVNYAYFKENDWPLGSGEIESAHRYIPQERLKIPGAYWNPNNVNPMLALRVVKANKWWGDFWNWRLERKKMTIPNFGKGIQGF